MALGLRQPRDWEPEGGCLATEEEEEEEDRHCLVCVPEWVGGWTWGWLVGPLSEVGEGEGLRKGEWVAAPGACLCSVVAVVVEVPMPSLLLPLPPFHLLGWQTRSHHKHHLVLLVLVVVLTRVVVVTVVEVLPCHCIPRKCRRDPQTGHHLGEEGGSCHQNCCLALQHHMSL